MPGDSAINLGMKEQNYSKSPRDGSQAEVMAEHSPLTEATKNWKMKPKTPTPRAASQGSGLKEDAHPQNMREFVPEPSGIKCRMRTTKPKQHVPSSVSGGGWSVTPPAINLEMEAKLPKSPRNGSQAQNMERKKRFLSAVSFTLAGAGLFAGFLSEALGFILGFAGILVALKLTLME